jgi:exfoliative toxin A/B
MACTIPIPLAGLMLGLASAGNIVPALKWLFGSLSLLFLVLRIVLDVRNFREELENPAIVGIICTMPMGVSILSTYLEPYLPTASFTIWIAAILTHIILIVYFTAAFIIKLDVKKFLPSYIVVYVDIAVGAVMAPVYGANTIGQTLF